MKYVTNLRNSVKTLLPTLLLSYTSCGAIPIYGIRPASWDGYLFDQEGKKAHELRVCKPTSAEEPCTVMFTKDAEAVLTENAALKKRIAELEKKCNKP